MTRPSSRSKRAPQAPATFEAAFAELQEVLARLEDGGLDLEAALALSDRGGELAETCNRLLDQAELRVTRLTSETASPLSDPPAGS
jgi:exodeoxyribonuclease VII small subunit